MEISIILGSILLFIILYKKNVETSIISLVALILGILYGYYFSIDIRLLPIMGFYSDGIKVMSILTIILGLMSNLSYFIYELKEDNYFKKATIFLLITTLIGALFSISLGDIFKLGISIIPLTVRSNFTYLWIIIFCIYILYNKNEDLYGVKKIIPKIIRYIPIVVFITSFYTMEISGMDLIITLIIFMILITLVSIIQILFVHGIIFYIVKKDNYIQFIIDNKQAYYFAFKSRSSLKTAPILARELSKKSTLTGAVLNEYCTNLVKCAMNACNGIYPALVCIFALNITGQELNLIDVLVILLGIGITSLAMRNIPGVATISCGFILAFLGLPLQGLFLIIALDYIVDRIRTTVNIIAVSNVVNMI